MLICLRKLSLIFLLFLTIEKFVLAMNMFNWSSFYGCGKDRLIAAERLLDMLGFYGYRVKLIFDQSLEEYKVEIENKGVFIISYDMKNGIQKAIIGDETLNPSKKAKVIRNTIKEKHE
jgi:hypothetical protein